MSSGHGAQRLALSGILFLFLIFAQPFGLAQEPVPDLSEASIEQLGQIQVYSASKHLEDVRQAPSSVTVITADEIRKHGYRTLADILRTVREFYVTYDRTYSYLGFRGFGRPGDYNTRVLLLIDGHRTNDNIYDQAMLGTEFSLDVDLIERVEVIRGPGSSLYGSNAFMAVINVITRSADDLGGWEVSFEPGSFDTYKGRLSWGGQLKGAETLLSGSIYDGGGQTLFFPEFNSPRTHGGIVKNMDYDRYRDFLLNTHYGGFSFQGLTSWRDKGIPTASFGTVFADPRTHNVDARQYLDLGYKAAIRRWEMGVRVYYDRYAYDGAWAYPGSELNIDYVRGQRWGSELQLSREVLRRHHLTFGVEQRDNLQQDQRNYDVLPAAVVYVDSARSSWMWAGFVQDEYLVTSHLSVSAGVRYDRDIAYNSSTNPRLGIIYRPLQGTSFKVLYGTAFRAPTAFEEYYGSAAATPDEYQQNPNLKSESIRNIEWVWEQDLGRRWQFSTDVFHNNIKDLIALERDPDSGSLKYQNTNQARSTGVGVEFGGRGWHRMEGSASYSFSETEDGKSNQILVNSPRHLGKVKATIPLLRQSLFGSFDMQYESSRETLQRTRIAGVPVLNTTLYGHALKRRLDISVSVYNLLDRGYNDVAPEEDRLTAVRQDGRSFRLKLAWHIGEK